jgi:hypothetical protein
MKTYDNPVVNMRGRVTVELENGDKIVGTFDNMDVNWLDRRVEGFLVPISNDTVVRRADGTFVPVSEYDAPLSRDGGPSGTIQNISGPIF